MRFLPIFLDTQAGPIVLVGAGEAARAKLRLLMASEARVRWYALHDSASDLSLPDNVERRDGDPLLDDLTGVIGVWCAGAGDVGATMAARARAKGVPVNVMDELSHSTFISPAVVDRGDVIVAVGTSGNAPVLARRVREQIETLLPARLGDLASLVGRWRKSVAIRLPDMPLRRKFWESVVDGPIGAKVLSGRIDDAERELSALAQSPDVAARGSVTLVGAGPGDPDLLTVKALRALQDADIVFHDELVSQDVLDRIRRDAARVPVGRRVGKPGIGQEAVNRLLIEAAQAGQRVVRLKGGDSFVFGRGGEEIASLRAAGIEVAVIPGITAALGAAAQWQVPLTFRHEALRITFLTAHKARDAAEVDWAALTDREMTVVVYMGITAAEAIRKGMLAAGRSADTPVGVFARVTRSDSEAVVGRLDQLPDLVGKIGSGPAILIIGDVVAHSSPWQTADLKQLVSELAGVE